MAEDGGGLEQIGVIGIGWVGLVTATCFASQGHEVWAMDIDEAKVRSLSAGELTIHEPELPELVRAHADRLHFTTSMRDVLDHTRLLFCCVDTPPTYSGDADLSRVMAVVNELDGDSEHALVMKSTVPAGTGLSIRRALPTLSYVSCPEFLKEGTAVADFLNPDRVVIGSDTGDEWARDAVADAYRPLGGELVLTDVSSAEMIKLASNAFLATKISFINEIANVCEEVGADVIEVANGMGLDQRIGKSFLRAGIGYGGSCLVGSETVLVRQGRTVGLRRLDDLFGASVIREGQPLDSTVVHPSDLEVLSENDSPGPPCFRRVEALTSRFYEGDSVEVRTKTGRRLTTTADHPFVVVDPDSGERSVKLARELTPSDWIPVASGDPEIETSTVAFNAVSGAVCAGLDSSQVIVRPSDEGLTVLAASGRAERQLAFADHPRGFAARSGDVKRAGALRLDEAITLRIPLTGGSAGTARNGTYVPFDLELHKDFWRVVGLYLAEGHCTVDGPHRRHRLQWSFHPTNEDELVEFVADFWRGHGVKASVVEFPTTKAVQVSSKILARWWLDRLGAGANAYEHKIPDLAWRQPIESRRSLLSGLWQGDGSWSKVGGGPSVVFEYGTVSPELADGIHRLLLADGLIASQRIGRSAKSTVDTYWLRLSGADQLERATYLLKPDQRQAVRAQLDLQSKRIKPMGHRRLPDGTALVRVVSTAVTSMAGRVYSMEVPGPETFVATAGLVTHNCFPKDVTALKQLAGNSGYHFQLLNAVVEVNELQKRRVLGKLTKHLDSLVGKRVALLGLAFKPDTDDMREASSLVLAARLQGEGAEVVAYDPVATEAASELLPSVEMAESAEHALEGADAVVLVTEWDQFDRLDWASLGEGMAQRLIIDGRNYLDPAAMSEAGFTYEGIGRGST